ncbi:hypothetical protein BD769DRAFT_1673442 [Suillus cothurnatus]|nr:hypothetical protein BD769DRAFT_1673442 [Suillus cothurnatus]
MTSAVMQLLDLFEDKGAFIFVEHQERGPPMFQIIRCADIKLSGTVGGRDPSCNVLIVTECIYDEPEQLQRTVLSLAYDRTVDTVCAESLELAERLAGDAITEHWLPCEIENMILSREL